jgi:predicted ATP-grasp superfamily ATP-dependent carboligase
MEDEPVKNELYELVEEPDVAGSPILLHALSGFLDAGAAGRITVEYLLSSLEHRTVATYDIDSMYDYRARRPRMVFDTDHYESFVLPELLLTELKDQSGVPFLLLHGPEPDIGWQKFTKSVSSLVDRFDVRLTVGVNAIPWASPHTRPVTVTMHANNSDLVVGRRAWIGAVEVPGHLAGIIEMSLGKEDKPALGFAVHVPHYLVNGEYPRAALTLLQEVSAATGLSLPLEELRLAADASDEALNAQVSENAENVQAIKALETQYDAMTELPPGSATPLADEPMLSGDEIAAQLEQFLRDLGENPGGSQI